MMIAVRGEFALSRIRDAAATRMARNHIAGPRLADALRVCRWASQRGWLSTVAFWNTPSGPPEKVFLRYDEAVRVLAGTPGAHLSIKIPDLGYDPGLLDALVDRARRADVFLQVDSLEHRCAERSLALTERMCGQYPRVGYTLAARWKRSSADAERLIGIGAAVRVVKGQWRDPSDPRRNPRTGFLELIGRLAGRAQSVAAATHDAPLARTSLIRLRGAGTACELEQVFGLPLLGDRVAAPLGVPCRLYVPFGNPYLPYNVRDFLRRPAILRWIARDLSIRPDANPAAKPDGAF